MASRAQGVAKTTGCRDTHTDPVFGPVACVLSSVHTPDHRGVLWVNGVPRDYYWPGRARKATA